MENKPNTVFEFRCRNHIVRMNMTRSGTYNITVTNTGRTFCDGTAIPDQTYAAADVVDRDLAVHCFNHTVQQYQKDVE